MTSRLGRSNLRFFSTGCGSAWLERHVRDVEAVGSNPTSPISYAGDAFGHRVEQTDREDPTPPNQRKRDSESTEGYVGQAAIPPHASGRTGGQRYDGSANHFSPITNHLSLLTK